MEATALSMGKSVLSAALGYAKSALAEEVALQLGIKRDQAFVRDELEMMLSFLMAAHDEQDKHKVVETWVKQVRVVAYDVEDSLMDFAVRVEKKSWWLPWRIPRTLRDRRHVAKQMKDLRAMVEDVSQRSKRYRLMIEGSSSKTATASDTAAPVAAMFGINEARYAAKTKDQPRLDLTQLINKEGEDLAVISVWGTGGNVGHTSIIWEAYENSEKNFPCRAWVRVMHPFNPKEFFQSLLEEFRPATGVNSLMKTEKTGQALLEEFHSYVSCKRSLIVLNGLSSIEEWNGVKKCFPINKERNVIIVSTTNVEVASLCVGQSTVVSELKQLSSDQTIYAFYKEPIAGQPLQTSTMHDSSQWAGEDGNTRTKSSQGVTYSTESVSGSTLPTSEIQEVQSMDADGMMAVEEGHSRTNMTAGAVEKSWWLPWRIPRMLRDRRHVAKQMKDLWAMVVDVNHRKNRYLVEAGSSSKATTSAGDTAASAAAMSRLDLTQLVNKEGEDLGVIALWGTSGNVGHTSIIREAFENPATVENFHCRAWFRVMHPFSPKESIRSLLEEVVHIPGQAPVEEFLAYINDKRCLIVLDDLSTIPEWNRVRKCFPINKKGNRVIVSTTNVEIASLCVGQNSVVAELKQLSVDQTIYAFYVEPITRQCVQTSTMNDLSQQAGEDGNTGTKSSQGVTYSTESVSSSTLPTSEIQEVQSVDADGMMAVEEGHSKTNMTAGAVEKSQVPGREEEKECIAKLILEHSDDHLKVVAVWGMGGVGKTTLVKDIYQRKEINDKFTRHAFVTVLRPFKLQELLMNIAIQLDAAGKKDATDFVRSNKKEYASMSVEHLTDELDQLSENRKCLIVVDDLLYTPEWDIIKEVFDKNKAKSWTIVITTRQKDIAEHCCKKPECIRKLNILGAEEARELFIKTVFKETVDFDKEYSELVEPAKLILNRCDGLPLAIVTIGSFLAEQEIKSAVDWRKLNAHISAELEMNSKISPIRAVLMKSYDGLPYYLKPCFLYMSIFPEDCNISRRRLVHRWAVEGYSAEARDKSCMEIADNYFEKLIERSMVLPTHESIFSRQKADSCKLHDLIRDISISMSTRENLVFRLEEGCSSNTHGTVRHLAISSNWEGDESEFQSIVELSRIRSLTVFGKWKSFYISDQMRFLRVLDLEDTEDLANHCLENIGKLLHLRYLSLRGCRHIFRLPDSVGNLSQLEVLDVRNTEIQVLPKTIVKLRKLRHIHAGDKLLNPYLYGYVAQGLSYCGRCMELLEVQCAACLGQFRYSDFTGRSRRDRCAIACCAALPPVVAGRQFLDGHGVTVPRGMRKVKSLHTLRYVHLAWGNAVVEEIKGLTSLRKLGVDGISKKNSQSLCVAISKHSLLESLSLSSRLDLSGCLDGIKPPPENLQSLKLRYCRMARLPDWIKGLQNLVKLTLFNTGLSRDGADMLMRDIGKLPNLRILRLVDSSDITIGEVQFKCDVFKRLEVLDLQYYYGDLKIESVKFDEEAMPKLEVLRLGLGQHAHFSGLEYLQSIKEVKVHYLPSTNMPTEETFCRELREQLDKNKKGHVLKVY